MAAGSSSWINFIHPEVTGHWNTRVPCIPGILIFPEGAVEEYETLFFVYIFCICVVCSDSVLLEWWKQTWAKTWCKCVCARVCVLDVVTSSRPVAGENHYCFLFQKRVLSWFTLQLRRGKLLLWIYLRSRQAVTYGPCKPTWGRVVGNFLEIR